MAKKSMIEREKKRQALVEKYAAKRAALKEIATDESTVVGQGHRRHRGQGPHQRPDVR